MNLLHRGGATLALLLLALAPLASAQSTPLEEIHKGSTAPMSFKADGYVARSAQELRDQNLDQLFPLSALVGIDWSKEMVLAVVMGPQSTGGYSITLESATLITTPFSTPGGALGSNRHLEVRVRKGYPIPGMPVTKQITNPFHVVKVKKTSEQVVFSDAGPAAARVFNSLQLTTTPAVGSHSLTVRVDKRGQATVTQNHPSIFFPPTPPLQLAAQEMAMLEALVRGARAGSIPGGVSSPAFTAATPFSLRIDSPLSTLHNDRIQGIEGDYGQYANRLQVLIGELKSIQQRVLDKANGVVEISGKVRVRGWRGWRTVYLVDGNTELKVVPWSFAKTLIPFNGYEVKIRGARGANDEVKARELLSPTRQRINGFARTSPQGPVLSRAHLEIFPPLADIRLTGRLARLMKRAEGRRVTAYAWMFGDKANPVALLISLDGNAKSATPLTRYGQTVSQLGAGDAVRIVGVSRSGRSVLVEGGSGGPGGYMRTSNASIGELNAPLHAGPVPLPSIGLSGVVNSSSNPQ